MRESRHVEQNIAPDLLSQIQAKINEIKQGKESGHFERNVAPDMLPQIQAKTKEFNEVKESGNVERNIAPREPERKTAKLSLLKPDECEDYQEWLNFEAKMIYDLGIKRKDFESAVKEGRVALQVFKSKVDEAERKREYDHCDKKKELATQVHQLLEAFFNERVEMARVNDEKCAKTYEERLKRLDHEILKLYDLSHETVNLIKLHGMIDNLADVYMGQGWPSICPSFMSIIHGYHDNLNEVYRDVIEGAKAESLAKASGQNTMSHKIAVF